MKLILCADVENLGKLGEVVTVKAGYGRNYLLPQGMAMLATDGNLKAFELERRKLQARMDAQIADARGLADRIEALSIVIPMHVGENEKLYGSVTSTMIGEAVAAQGVEIDRRRILLDGPIRTLGEHIVRVRLHADVMAQLPVKVVSDQLPEEPEEPEEAPAAEAPEAPEAE